MEIDISTGGNLGISSYGVSMTTLEEVFLHLCEEEEEKINSEDSNKLASMREKLITRYWKLFHKSIQSFILYVIK